MKNHHEFTGWFNHHWIYRMIQPPLNLQDDSTTMNLQDDEKPPWIYRMIQPPLNLQDDSTTMNLQDDEKPPWIYRMMKNHHWIYRMIQPPWIYRMMKNHHEFTGWWKTTIEFTGWFNHHEFTWPSPEKTLMTTTFVLLRQIFHRFFALWLSSRTDSSSPTSLGC